MLADKPSFFNKRVTVPPSPKYSAIAVTNIQVGEGDTIATCDLKVGGLLIRGVRVRRGRQDSVFVNFPGTRIDGRWVDTVEITSRPLEDACRQVVLNAVAEATR